MKTILLPDGVADAWFHVTAGGEVYQSNICRGRDLRAVMGELVFGNAEEECDEMDAIMDHIADKDSWWVQQGKCCTCSVACGEDPDVEIHLIDDRKLVSLLNAQNYERESLFA